jgi:hypothetical protein
MIRIPAWRPNRASRALILLALGPLIGWLPLLGLDALQSLRQQPASLRQSAANRPTGSGGLGVRQPSKRHPAKPVRDPSSTTSSAAGPNQTPAQPRAKNGKSGSHSNTGKSRKGGSNSNTGKTGSNSKTGFNRRAIRRKRPAVALQQRRRPSIVANSVVTARRQPPSPPFRRKPAVPAPLPPALRASLMPKRPSGASLLGNLDLSSLEEKPMITAARLERASQIASPDPLSVVPKALKSSFLATIAEGERVIPAEIVRLPAHHLQAGEQIPVLLRPGGRAQGPSAWSSAATRMLVEGWLARQPAVVNGSVRPVVLKLEPLPGSSSLSAAQPKTKAQRPKRPRSPAPRAKGRRAKAPSVAARPQRRQLGGSGSKPSGPTPSPLTPTTSIRLEGFPSSVGTPSAPADRLPPPTP